MLPLLALALAAPPAAAQSLTQDEALALAFPGATVERRTAFLDEAQLAEARAHAGADVPVESGVVTHYVAFVDDAPVGAAYFDSHIVRTHPEVLMIAVASGGRASRVEVVRFREPAEYRPPERWLAQFTDAELDERLSLKGDIAGMTGATLTARAVTRATRRVLALHRVIDPLGEAR